MDTLRNLKLNRYTLGLLVLGLASLFLAYRLTVIPKAKSAEEFIKYKGPPIQVDPDKMITICDKCSGYRPNSEFTSRMIAPQNRCGCLDGCAIPTKSRDPYVFPCSYGKCDVINMTGGASGGPQPAATAPASLPYTSPKTTIL